MCYSNMIIQDNSDLVHTAGLNAQIGFFCAVVHIVI